MPTYLRIDGVDPDDIRDDSYRFADQLYSLIDDAGYDLDGVVPVVNEDANAKLVDPNR